MKKYQIIFTLLLFIGVSSCKKDLTSEGVSTTETYVRFDLTGPSTLILPIGTNFVDPGYKGVEGTTDVTDKVKVVSTVDGSTLGLYTITYSAVNIHGYSSSLVRTVIIYNPKSPDIDLSGGYSSTVNRVKPARSFKKLNVDIVKIATGFFYISDFIGGFYDQGAAYLYGSSYAVTGYFVINQDNTLSLVSSQSDGFSATLNDFQNGIYDPETGELSWDAFYTTSNYQFSVVLTKK